MLCACQHNDTVDFCAQAKHLDCFEDAINGPQLDLDSVRDSDHASVIQQRIVSV